MAGKQIEHDALLWLIVYRVAGLMLLMLFFLSAVQHFVT
jgi:hypothetical protein